MSAGQQPTSHSVLGVLPKARLVDLGRDYSVAVPADTTKEQQIALLVEAGKVRFRDLLAHLGRDELKAACRAHGLDDSGRSRPTLASRLLGAHGATETAPPAPLFVASEIPRYAPQRGDIVACRHRQWLVEDVVPPPAEKHATRVRLVCLDDDDPGRVLEVLWELELGARVRKPEAHGLGDVTRIDEPRHFGAYLHALKWNAVTATDARLFQAPFRAGIKLLEHQLLPLQKALSLPRANLFIADDVGLGKTIEAGLVLQELLLRQRVEFALILCPAAVCLQWRDEMQKRFGLHFEVMSRKFIARRRQERGFGVNPWSTHNRFIVSHQTIRRPEYRDPLLQHIGERARKSLLILDEAHAAAPASASKYATDSRFTGVVRDIAPRFENRLFLSATPHNGHSNSFSALLEILDPQRFTRGVPVRSVAQLEPVMVRRLKEDLRQLGVEGYPLRKLVQVALTHGTDTWTSTMRTRDAASARYDEAPAIDLGRATGFEIELSEKLAEYTALMKPEKGAGRLVFINLQKRLLSSVEAFARTLRLHAGSAAAAHAEPQLPLASRNADDDEYGEDDEAIEEAAGAEVARASATLVTPAGRARALLDDMQRLAEQHRGAPDAKTLALVHWIRAHQCPGARIGGADRKHSPTDRRWTDRRVIVFTEYGDTKRYLWQLLSNAVEGTDRADERIMQFHGGMSDEQREEVQRAFNGPPGEYPVRILLATDAAREGVNLQGHCYDLFHYDVPWNPARMEQRNGRIDRTLQSEPIVNCHYFVYPQRTEDLVLEKLVGKVDTIQRELGSLSAILMDRMADVMDDGIGSKTSDRIDAVTEVGAQRETAKSELEAQREDQAKLRAELEEAGTLLNDSAKVLEFDRALLRDAIDVGLGLSGAGKLDAVDRDLGSHGSWRLPELPDSWQSTLDTLRTARGRDEGLWEWRKKAPPLPVIFEPPPKMNSALVQLHLAHPFVQRIFGRFLAQGFSAHDLSRVTVIRTRHDALVRVIAFGRLSLFGAGAARLHDQILSVAARWVEGSSDRFRPFAEEADRNAIRSLEKALTESPTLDGISSGVRDKVRAAAPKLFSELWSHIQAEADAHAKDAEDKLKRRGREEADALRRILEDQREAINRELRGHQLPIDFGESETEKTQRAQWDADRKHMEQRLRRIDDEIATEPAQIESLYNVALRRLEPVGLIILWPETRG